MASTSVRQVTTNTTRRVVSDSNDDVLNLNYKSPQQAYNDALNYSEDELDSSGNTTNTTDSKDKSRKVEKLMTNMLKSVNDSKYIYPTIAIIVLSILVVIVLFQKISLGIKILSVLLLLLFIAFTVFINKN